MNLKDFVDGIAILQKYYKKPNGYHLGADHDIIYLYATDTPVNEEDLKTLLKLGWFQENGCNEDEPDRYNKNEGWAAYS